VRTCTSAAFSSDWKPADTQPEEEHPMLQVGDKAPDFSLPSDSGASVSLKDLLGKTLVLYFFPKADTPG